MLRLPGDLQSRAGRRGDPARRGRPDLAAAAHAARGRRALEFPGGFVELGESIEEAARRETREELEIGIELGELVGVCSRGSERTVLVVLHARALGTPRETAEASEVRAFAPGDLPSDEMTFWSTQQALRDALA